jgi:probable addiction module antidote protein
MTTSKKKKPVLRSFDRFLLEQLKDPKFAVEYLRASLRDGDQEDFAQAVREVIKAQGNITHFAEDAGVARKTVNKMLAGKGDLSFKSLWQVLAALGGRFDVAPAAQPRVAAGRRAAFQIG